MHHMQEPAWGWPRQHLAQPMGTGHFFLPALRWSSRGNVLSKTVDEAVIVVRRRLTPYIPVWHTILDDVEPALITGLHRGVLRKPFGILGLEEL